MWSYMFLCKKMNEIFQGSCSTLYFMPGYSRKTFRNLNKYLPLHTFPEQLVAHLEQRKDHLVMPEHDSLVF